MGPADEEAKVLKKIAELNLGQSTSAFSKFGCKNAGFVEAMVLRGTSLHRGGFELTEVRRKKREKREGSERQQLIQQGGFLDWLASGGSVLLGSGSIILRESVDRNGNRTQQ